MLIFSLFTFVACGDKDNDGNDDSPTIDPLVENLIGYVLTHDTSYTEIELRCAMYNKNNDAEYDGEMIGFVNVLLSDIDYEDEVECSLCFFETSEKASSFYEKYHDDNDGEFEYIFDENIMIKQSGAGMYDAIKKSTIPSNVLSKNALNFIKSNLKLEAPKNAQYIMVELMSSNSRGIVFSMLSRQSVGNCVEEYMYGNQTYVADADNLLQSCRDEIERGIYTSDSYIRDEDDGVYMYLNTKEGFIFEEIDGGYAVDGYHFKTEEGRNVVIPSEYNGKPVIKINEYAIDNDDIISITIPASITVIEYHGIRSATINCAAASKPAGWDDDWCYSYDDDPEIVWGYNG
ncbi:MAG: hypothetical protein NC037_01605 [Bacteroides sp.]|nr:hypothetical protein [Bacillota bacterium]MCM1393691.1 hypothetical protein [[Eubacterium] siraeum]MCM1455210.1 hypothetical protein [Bacteroides sp.]